MIKLLQDRLPEIWTDEGYSEEFKGRKSEYKHFDHTITHVQKAAQALKNMCEEADHGKEGFPAHEIKKFVADIVISAVRLSYTSPTGPFDLERAIRERIETKMKVTL